MLLRSSSLAIFVYWAGHCLAISPEFHGTRVPGTVFISQRVYDAGICGFRARSHIYSMAFSPTTIESTRLRICHNTLFRIAPASPSPCGHILWASLHWSIKAKAAWYNPPQSQGIIMLSKLTLALFLTTTVTSRTFTVYNACPFTIWPAVFTDLNVGSAVPAVETGWEAPAWSVKTFYVPDNWKAGRIWGRRNCNFSSNPGPNSCLTGGCNGGLLCDAHSGTGVPPASVAEWTLSGDNGSDNYDVSLVDGYNLPMRISNNKGCPVAECAVDLGPNCPAELKGPYDASGFPVGCKSACVANLSGNPANSPNCCSGQYDTPATCPSSGVAFYSYFKNNCPRSYAYAYDESSGTALFTCPTGLAADYTLTFCP